MAVVIIDRTTGTNIGNMTEVDGLAAAFDGSAVNGQSAAKTNTASAFIGKTLAAPKRFARAVVYGSPTQGFVLQGQNPNMTINIRGKNGAAPSGATDGTIVGTSSFTDTADESAGRTIQSTDRGTSWDHLFAEITHDGGSLNIACTELDLYANIPDCLNVIF